MRTRLTILLALALLVSACGGKAAEPSRSAPPLPVDDAFAVRIAGHQQTGLALARAAATEGKSVSVRKLAGQIAARREKTLPMLLERLADVPSRDGLPDLGVSPQEAADGIGPDALDGARPLDTAFLTLMAQHNRGALALVRAELKDGKDPATKAIAQRVGADVARELDRLNAALADVAQQTS
ncbi:DUF305 domain-containing protein [Solirubrobacter pauli]|uniref:DUF305 domain-containing protein n=1 Tax=Solirubrobacter pauli TaxID=166793 RepID=UPI00147730AA|nr:DUF305 domain-containing protein [Solirubrobacter pauli]